MDLPSAIAACVCAVAAGLGARVLLSVRQIAQDGQSSARAEQLTEMGFSVTAEQADALVDGISVRYQRDTARGVHLWSATLPTASLRLHPQPASTYRERFVKLGDPHFDARYALWGKPADLAWLGPEVRASFVRLAELQPRICEGQLQIERPRFQPSDLDLVVGLARQIRERPADPVERLELLLRDALPDVRVQCLWAMRAGGLAQLPQLAPALLGDPDEQVRATAATVLKDIEGLWRAATSQTLPPALRKEAAGWLRSVADPLRRCSAGEALIGEEPMLQLVGIDLLRSVGSAGESALLSLVPGADEQTLLQVLSALEQVGTIRAVVVLRARQAALSRMQAGLSERIEQVIAAIQRGIDPQRGLLSLAEIDGVCGALSEVAAPSGLALSPRDPAAAPRG